MDVTGTIKDTNGKPVPFANLTFRKQDTTKTDLGVLGNEDGSFHISLQKAVYLLEISIIGTRFYNSEIDLTEAKTTKNLGTIVISTDIILDEVIVKTDDYRHIELDKKVYDVTKDLQVTGGSLIDAMQNLPSVQVEVDGSVSIRGDAQVQILVDGRISGLTSTASLLRTIPAASIEKIEVITNPSSKYNAEGTGGIINVILKKGKNKNFTGSVELFSGIRINSGLNVNINRGGNKISWYYNGGLGYSEPKAISNLETDKFDETEIDTRQNSERVLEQFYVLNNMGSQWKIDKKNKLGIEINQRFADLNTKNNIRYSDFIDQEIFSISTREDIQTYTNSFFQSQIDYELDLSDKGAKIDVGLMLQFSNEDGVSSINDLLLFPNQQILNEDLIQNIIEDKRNTQWVDWMQPIGKNKQLEFGVRNRNTTIDNDFEVRRNTDNNTFIIPEFTDNTTYDEHILALYGQYAHKFKKLSFQLGLRSETTNIIISTTDAESKIQYTDLFPSGFLEYNFKNDQSLRLSISRRIRRPRRNALVPFSSFSDARNIFVGNPSVNPTYTIISELGYLRKFDNLFSITPTLFYRNSNNIQDFFVQQRAITIDNELQEVFEVTTVNIGRRNSLGLELSATFKPISWLSLYAETIVSYFNQIGQFDGVNYNSDGWNSSGRVHFNFDFMKTFTFQLQHRFRGGNKQGQLKREAIYRMDIALRQKVFNDKGLLTLNAKDVFNTWKFRVTTNGQGFDQQLISQIRTPQLNIAFSYLFNQKKYKGKKGQQYDKLD